MQGGMKNHDFRPTRSVSRLTVSLRRSFCDCWASCCHHSCWLVTVLCIQC